MPLSCASGLPMPFSTRVTLTPAGACQQPQGGPRSPAARPPFILHHTHMHPTTRPLIAPSRLGHLDPPSKQPFNYLTYDVIGSAEHHATARQMLQQGIVLLKNTNVG